LDQSGPSADQDEFGHPECLGQQRRDIVCPLPPVSQAGGFFDSSRVPLHSRGPGVGDVDRLVWIALKLPNTSAAGRPARSQAKAVIHQRRLGDLRHKTSRPILRAPWRRLVDHQPENPWAEIQQSRWASTLGGDRRCAGNNSRCRAEAHFLHQLRSYSTRV